MQFGVQVNVYRTSWDAVRTSVLAMEEGPWDSLWFADHFIPPGARREDEQLTAFEGLSAIAAVAGMTKKLRLGHLVLGNTYRNPALVAKIAGTIDHVSEGRFTLGIGAAWYKREHEAYGWAFPSMQERQDRFEEACEILRALFRATEPVDFNGQYYSLDKASLSPGSYQQPHIPILVGGTGEKRTLRTLAKYGDKDLIARAVKNLGPGTVAGSKQYIIDRIGEFENAGVSEIMFGGIASGDVERLQHFEADIIAAFR